MRRLPALLFLSLGLVGLPAGQSMASREALPSNGLIAFVGDDDIYTVDPVGGSVVNLTNTPGASETTPDWSLDGTKIAYTLDGDIHVMDADGSSPIPVTQARTTTPLPTGHPTASTSPLRGLRRGLTSGSWTQTGRTPTG
jgi:hypothetical protein